MTQKIETINFQRFVSKFMDNDEKRIEFVQAPIQIYPLSIAFSYIKVPVPLFRTDHNFLLLFEDGGGEQQVDNEILELKANDVLFIREGHLNGIKSIHPSTSGYYIHIDSLLLSQIFPDRAMLNRFTFSPKHEISKADMDWLCQCCELLTQHKLNFSASDEIESSLLKAMVLKIAQSNPVPLSKSNRQSEISMRFKELLYENYKNHKELKFYADKLLISENYLNRCVKDVTNKAPKQHINEVIIYNSKVLLLDLSKDISQIAYELNFADASYFGRLFKQITNLTPSQYRNSLKQELSEL